MVESLANCGGGKRKKKKKKKHSVCLFDSGVIHSYIASLYLISILLICVCVVLVRYVEQEKAYRNGGIRPEGC